MNDVQWAIKWGIPFEALADRRRMLGLDGDGVMPARASGVSEKAVDAVVCLEAARLDIPLWRNNVGALKDEYGNMVRYGLANENRGENKLIASADRIGIRKVLITQAMVGTCLGQFVSREVKKVGWRYTGADNEPQQWRWAELILSYGGDAAFATGEGSL